MGLGRPADTDPHLLNRGLRENPGSFLQVLPDPTPSPGRLSLAGHQGAPPPTVGLSPPPPSGPSPAGPSPTVHPIQSPQNRFCVLTLDPETLPALATTLIDVLFYSHRWAPWHWSTHLVPGLLPITFRPPLGSAVLCPVPWLGFLAVCDTPVPCTEVQARPQSHSWGPLPTLAWAEPPELCPGQALWTWGKILFVTFRVHHPLPSPAIPAGQGPQTKGEDRGPGGSAQGPLCQPLCRCGARLGGRAGRSPEPPILPSPPREAASGGPGSSSITFFAFSLIEGYISIVMDAETQKK